MVWYKDWFNSAEYLKVYRHRDSAEAELLVNLIQKNTNLANNSCVLDMACGAGRHAIAFAIQGFKVTAVDLSERLIAEAKKNSAQSNIEINFILSDIRELDLTIRFDLAVNLFTSFGYFQDDEENFAIIEKAYNLLKPTGFFVLDYFNKCYLQKNLVPSTKMTENGNTIIQQRSIVGNRVEKKIAIEKDDTISKFYESVRLYDYTELEDMLEMAGFRVRNVLGDFTGSKFDESISPRTIIFSGK